MRSSRFTDEQIERAVWQAEAGAPVEEIARTFGVSEATVFTWKKRIAVRDTPELTRLREENARLNALVSDLSVRPACKPCAEKRAP